ncbi:Josephin-domain-containing protein [Phlegmacium glaucopus]|nr:Josephin-domain-containing protein [Phlegmacium glaucopus]
MAGLERLIPYVYHEKQQQGSMLCAQHALNSLLQDNYFAASDLSDIARGLDHLEESYDDNNTGSSSTNMDDTGFFSVQVLDKALTVWGLNLTRWRSQDLRRYQDKPQTQLGFILNLQQHWFTLRRFGNASANVDQDEGDGHWFNLNSFLPQPEWVGKLYLGMVLQQAEAEGYSVFAVTQADPDSPLALPRTEADMIASTLPEPTSASTIYPERSLRSHLEEPRSRESSDHVEGHEGFEDEDYQLQAALQASLMGNNLDQPPFSPSRYIPTPQPSMTKNSSPRSRSGSADLESGSHATPPTQHIGGSMPLPGHADVDPVVASAERNRVLLQRMKEEQEYAQREVWSGADLTPEEQIALQARREQRQREEQEEAEAIRKAIEESKVLAQRSHLEAGEDTDHDMNAEGSHTSIGFIDGNRVYDDDDAELQAALKASLERIPPVWHPAPNHPPLQHPLPPSDVEDTESIISDTASAAEESTSEVSPAVSLDEIRRRRLARFGVQP